MILTIGVAFFAFALPTFGASQTSQAPTQGVVELRGVQQLNANDTQRDSHTYLRGTKESPLFVEVVPTSNTDSPVAKHTARPKQESSEDWGVIIPTWILAFATIGLFLYTARLWSATGQLVKDAKETANRQLRAYVAAQEVKHGISTQFDGECPYIDGYIFSVVWENVGKTPAQNLHSVIQPEIFPANEDREPSFSLKQIAPQKIALGPNQKTKTGDLYFPIDVLRSVWLRQQEIILWARVEYNDALEPDIIRYTERCVRIDFIHDPQDIPPPGHPPYVMFSIYGPQNGST
jgi:hypothetical protein